MSKIYIVRHGKTDWNVKGLLQGTADIELNEEGKYQVKALSKQIDLSEIDICICSPLKRARQTSEILVSNKIKVVYDNSIVERGFGNYEGKQIDYDLIFKQWDYKLNDSSNNIESIKDCLLRAKKFLDKIKKNYTNKTILIISHGSFIKALHFNLIGYDETTDFLSFNPENSVLYEYELDDKLYYGK